MPKSISAIDQLRTLFERQPCWMIDPIGQHLGCSIVSVRRYLVQAGYFSSFTHNGRWYTLSSIPRFCRDGLWFHKDIGFSKAGSLTRTLVGLIDASAAGMTAEALGQKLHCRLHSVLVGLCRQGRLQRERRGRSHVYLSADPRLAQNQRQTMKAAPAAPLPAEIAVLVMAEYIRHPRAELHQLAKAVSVKTGLSIDTDRIRSLFEHYGLKKTLRQMPSIF